MYIRDYIKTLSKKELTPITKKVIDLMPSYIKKDSQYVTYNKGDNLLTKSEELQYVYYVIDGSFNVVNEFESGKIYEPVILEHSDFIGVVETILNHKETISTLKAQKDAEVFQIRKELFIKWMNDSHELTKMVLKSVASNFIKNMIESGESVILSSRYMLVSHLLQHSNMVDDNYMIDEAREKTSIRTGINLRTLYRHIKELKQEKLISTKGRKIFFDESQKDLLYKMYQDLRNK